MLDFSRAVYIMRGTHPLVRAGPGGKRPILIFGKHINRYYLKYGPRLLLGAVALVLVDYVQLILPELYRMLVNGLNTGEVLYKGAQAAFTMDFLLDRICLPIVYIIVVMVIGRFLWRVCFFGAAIKVETEGFTVSQERRMGGSNRCL